MAYFRDPTLTNAWLNKPVKSFKGKSPLEYAKDENKAEEVLDYLENFNLEH